MLSATSYFDCLRDVKIPGELGTRELATLNVKDTRQRTRLCLT